MMFRCLLRESNETRKYTLWKKSTVSLMLKETVDHFVQCFKGLRVQRHVMVTNWKSAPKQLT
jgi:protein tyrosine phosphatase